MENPTRKYGKYIATLAFIAAITLASGAGKAAEAAAVLDSTVVTEAADGAGDPNHAQSVAGLAEKHFAGTSTAIWANVI